MIEPTFLLLFVEDPAVSAGFYARALGRAPLETSPTFVMFALGGGWRLGLWRREGVQPSPTAGAFGGEIGVPVEVERLEPLRAALEAAGARIAQPIVAADFGPNFLALDPDGHRIRVFAPGG
ncbi:MAG: drug:proton antiporter [Rhizobiales bacterium]|nr:drug:proton antiporter [Hyphomicrobiales bacterium]